MSDNNELDLHEVEEHRKELDEIPGAGYLQDEKDLEIMIEQYLFTPRIRSEQQAQEFLKDWMQRYNRG